MKTLILLCLTVLGFVACKKTRECSCAVTSKNTSTSVPLKGGSSSQNSGTGSYTTFAQFENVSAKQFRQEAACQSRIESSVYSYTNTVQMSDSVVNYLVTVANSNDYNCEIK